MQSVLVEMVASPLSTLLLCLSSIIDGWNATAVTSLVSSIFGTIMQYAVFRVRKSQSLAVPSSDPLSNRLGVSVIDEYFA